MKYDSLFDPMVLLFVGSSYVIYSLGRLFDGSERANHGWESGHLYQLLGYASLASYGHWFPL